MPLIKSSQLPVISDTISKLIKKSDDRRLQFTSTVLTIYTVVTSGLVALASALDSLSTFQKISFLGLVTTSVTIVMAALMERLGYFLVSQEIATKYKNHVNQTGEHLNKQIGGKKWHTKLINICTWTVVVALALNVIFALTYVYSSILE